MSRRPFIAGNWKMHTSTNEAVQLCTDLREALTDVRAVDVAVCPPFVHLARARDALAGSPIQVGAQNCHWEASGAFTGEVAAPMLKGLAQCVIIGHSERRQYFCETDETVNKRLRAVLEQGLTPIFCCGETQAEREAGKTNNVLARQVHRGLDGLSWDATCVVAYEPVWAIGTGLAATDQQANDAIGYIRNLVADMFGAQTANAMRVQYGGSVKAVNAAGLFAQPEVDGALVGGASLDAADFAAIVRAAAPG
jgi:triosephosphate isomerase